MRVLVIEDEQKMADLIKRGLEEEGMDVETANDGDVGFEAGKSENIDLIILDLALPGRNGLDMARDWRRIGIKTPILIVTAMDSTEAKVKGLDTAAEDTTKLQLGDLTLNLINRRASRAGNEVQLTNKEFALLEFFMRHPDEILSREVLSEKVWEETFDTLTNVIDVYINYLRNKIDRHYEPKLIHTVRGVGYMLKTPTAPSKMVAESKAS